MYDQGGVLNITQHVGHVDSEHVYINHKFLF